MSAQQGELTVLVKARDLAAYVFDATASSPKRYLHTLVGRMQNHAVDAAESIYRANLVYVTRGDEAALNKRLGFQHDAIVSIQLLCWIAEMALARGCVLMKQYENIARRAEACRVALGAWIASDRKRFRPAEG